jgi:hypothetical protein
MLHTGLVKGFMDGSLGSRTAALLAPYADDPGNTGLPQYAQAQLNAMATDRVAARFQMGFHAIGDRGAEMALQAFAEAARYARQHHIGPPTAGGFRHRIEHCQVLAPDQFARFRELNVIASVQPNHLLTDMNWAEARLGAQYAANSYAWRKLLDSGVRLAFGTDYPVEPITPFRGLYAAITRKNEAGTKEYFPQQKISIQQAIAAYTSGAAYAEFAEAEKGVLAPGMLADFVVLDRDITQVSPAELLRTQVLRTVVGGSTVFRSRDRCCFSVRPHRPAPHLPSCLTPMLRNRLIWRDLSRRRGYAPWQRGGTWAESHRAYDFFLGAPFALLPAILALPVWAFLVHLPRFRYARVSGGVLLGALLAAAAFGMARLVRCLRGGEVDLYAALAVGVLLITFVVFVYTGMFVLLVTFDGPPSYLFR